MTTLAQVDTEDTVFTCENTFVYRKSARSANEARNAAKVILYAVPEEGIQIPAVENTEVKVQEYDEEEGLYKDSEVSFTVSAAPYLDGLPAAVDDSESDRDDVLNQALGGDIVAEGPVFTVTAENTDLPKGLYAVEVKLVFEASGEAADLQQFAAAHSAGLEDYSAALETECEPWAEAGGQVSSSRFGYRGDGETSVFRKLLEFDRLTNELIAAGAAGEPVHKTMTFRLVIDNR